MAAANSVKKKSYWHLIKGSVLQWIEDEPFSLAAALSYYTLFSLAPLLVIAISVAGFAFEREAAQNQVVAALQGVIGEESAQAVQGVVENASKQPKTGIVSTVVGVVALLFGAGGVVGQLQTSLNMLWGVTPKPGQGVWGFIRQRFLSFAMVLGIGFLLLVSLAVSAFVTPETLERSKLSLGRARQRTSCRIVGLAPPADSVAAENSRFFRRSSELR